MSTPIDEAFARLSMLEFAVEVMLANQLAGRPAAESEQFRADFIAKFRDPQLPEQVSSSAQEQLEAWIVQRTIQMSERLMQKVADRELEIRRRHTRS